MKKHRGQLWSAYIDGEITLLESNDFLESLSDDDRWLLDAELRFERALSSQLAAKAECPDTAWSAARRRIAADESRLKGPYIFLFRRTWKVAALAAAAVLMVLLLKPSVYPPAAAPKATRDQTGVPDFLRAAPSVEALAATTQVSDDLDSVRAFLKNNNVNIGLKPLSSIELPAGHVTALRGARSTFYRGTEITELLYECCGQPLKIILVKNDSAPAGMIKHASPAGPVQAWRQVGNYCAALVGLHEARKLLDLLEDGKEVVG